MDPYSYMNNTYSDVYVVPLDNLWINVFKIYMMLFILTTFVYTMLRICYGPQYEEKEKEKEKDEQNSSSSVCGMYIYDDNLDDEYEDDDDEEVDYKDTRDTSDKSTQCNIACDMMQLRNRQIVRPLFRN